MQEQVLLPFQAIILRLMSRKIPLQPRLLQTPKLLTKYKKNRRIFNLKNNLNPTKKGRKPAKSAQHLQKTN